jgi:simple sugar transport system substrate-binding protein
MNATVRLLNRTLPRLFLCCLMVAFVLAAVGRASAQSDEELVVGFILVGPQDDRGWSQAHFNGSEYMKENVPGVRTIVLDRLNVADRPNVTLEQVVENMVSEGASVIFPDVTFIHVSGDAVLRGEAPENLGNVMGRMEYMKMAAGCAAALATETNNIAYLGPLINAETRRLTVSAYLGAKHCFETYRDGDAADLTFTVRWIGFWFNIPGVTLDPTEVANNFFNEGADVIISGIDTTEGIVTAQQRAERGEQVFAVPYDYEGACELGEDVCLGVPYFNWGPAYADIITQIKEGTWESSWDWLDPYWEDINDLTRSAVGFLPGPQLTEEQQANLDDFISQLADGSLNLFSGPLNYQDGTPFLAEGEVATDEQVWYMPQLLEGMIGESQPAE